MWNRRCELNLLFTVAHVFRHTHPAMKELEVPQVPAWADANRPRVIDFLRILNDELASRPFIAGEHFTVADISALCAVDFMKPTRIQVPDELTNLKRWHAGVAARPSAKA
jgi:glutathione S-transferase